MYKVIIGLDQFRHAFNNNKDFITGCIFLYTNGIPESEPSRLVLRAIDKGFNSHELSALVDLLATRRIGCIRDMDIYAGPNNNYKTFTKETWIEAQKAAGRFESDAIKAFDLIECIDIAR